MDGRKKNPNPVAFPTTQWALVQRAGATDPLVRNIALGEIIKRYAPAIHSYLVMGKGLDSSSAQDTVQEFLLSKVLEQELLKKADQRRGKLRALLLEALNRFLIGEHRKRSAQKRSSGQELKTLEQTPEPVSEEADPNRVFDVAWARGVLTEVLERMEKECRAQGRADQWGVFDSRMVGPILRQEEPQSCDALMARYHLTSPAQASNLLMTAKRTFIRLMRTVISEYVSTEAEIDQEIADLEHVLSP